MAAAKKHSTYMIFFLSYVSILLIAISSLLVYYAQITQQVTIETQKSKITLLNQLEDNINQKVKYADVLMSSVIPDDKLSIIARGYDFYTYKDLMAAMQSAYKPDYLINFSVYFSNNQEIVTEGTRMKASDFFQYMYHISSISYEDFSAQYLSGYKYRALEPPIMVQQTFGGKQTTVIPYVQSFPINSNSTTQGQILVLFDTKDICELIQQLNSSTRSYVYILNQNDQVILSSEQAPAPTDDFIKELHQQGETFQTKMNQDASMITQITSSGNKWKYVMATPKKVYFQDNAKFAFTCIIIFLIYLAAGLVIVRFLARRSYQPIKEIKDIINDYHADNGNGDEKNEFYTIKNTIINQFHTDQKLNEIIQSQIPIVRQAYFVSLLKGLEVNYNEAQSKLPSLGVNLVSQSFIVAALEFDLDSPVFMESEQFAENEFSLARAVVQNVSSELMNENRLCYFLDIDRNEFMLLLNVKQDSPEQEALEQFKDRLNTLVDFASANFKLNINIGISMMHSDIKSLPKCYDEAEKALESSKMKQSYHAVCFGEENDISLDYYFSTETEYQLVNLLKRGNYRESKELLNNIFEINKDSHTAMNSQAYTALINDIASALVRVINGILTVQKKPPVVMESLLTELEKSPSLDSAKSFFIAYVDQIADASENRVVRKTELLVNNIVEFINNNAGEKWLDLNFLSHKFEITPQYISNIFKKYQNENIKDYISKLKLKRAKELLVTTNLSLHDISVSLGYVNELGIFRLFRKYEDTTPGEYRAIHKKLS